MRPLQSIAMGLVIVALHAAFRGYDALPDPAGWLLVLLGSARLPPDLERRGTLLGLAALAGAVSVPLWFPGVADSLYDTHASLAWAANLPQLGFVALLCHVLGRRAGDAGDGRAAAWLRTALVGVVVFALTPVLVFGAGVTSLEVPSYLGATTVLVVVVWLLFGHSGRGWAGADTARAAPPEEERPS